MLESPSVVAETKTGSGVIDQGARGEEFALVSYKSLAHRGQRHRRRRASSSDGTCTGGGCCSWIRLLWRHSRAHITRGQASYSKSDVVIAFRTRRDRGELAGAQLRLQ